MKVAHLARKPISEGSIGRNVLKHGTGGLNIDGTRIHHSGPEDRAAQEAMVEKLRQRGGKLGGSWKNSSDLSGANPVNAAGRWPANAIFIHKPGCRLAGTRQALGYKINQWTDGAKPFGGSAGSQYQTINVPEATEEVWVCVEGCPVKELDGHSGVGSGTVRQPTGKSIYPTSGTSMTWNPNDVRDSTVRGFSDSGGASRFFKQVQGDHEFFRAGGDVLCPICGREYRRHPEDFRYLDSENQPFLQILCDGSRVKL